MFIEKKGELKKIKGEINAFKTGINSYEQYLQLKLNIDTTDNTIYISMNNLKNHTSYTVILEEIDNNNFKRKFSSIYFI